MRGFTGIDLPHAIKAKISKARDEMMQYDISAVSEESMHITLHFFEDIKEEQKTKVIEAMESLDKANFDIGIRGLGYFGGEAVRVVFAKVDDPQGMVSLLYDKLGEKLSAAGVDYDKKKEFVPHVTIARCKFNNQKIKTYIEQHSEDYFGNFTVNRISFKKSELSPSGPVYTELFNYQI